MLGFVHYRTVYSVHVITDCNNKTKTKKSRLSRSSAGGSSSASLTWSTRPTTGCRSRSISWWAQPQEPPLATVKRRKLALFGHVTHHDGLFTTILQDTLEGERPFVRQRKCWTDNIKDGPPCPCQNCSRWPPAKKNKKLEEHLC